MTLGLFAFAFSPDLPVQRLSPGRDRQRLTPRSAPASSTGASILSARAIPRVPDPLSSKVKVLGIGKEHRGRKRNRQAHARPGQTQRQRPLQIRHDPDESQRLVLHQGPGHCPGQSRDRPALQIPPRFQQRRRDRSGRRRPRWRSHGAGRLARHPGRVRGQGFRCRTKASEQLSSPLA